MTTIFVAIKGIKPQDLTEQERKLLTKEALLIKRKEDDGTVAEYTYLEFLAEGILKFNDQNEYSSWRDKNGIIEE